MVINVKRQKRHFAQCQLEMVGVDHYRGIVMKTVLIVVFLHLLPGNFVYAGEFTVDQVMSKETQRDTGIANLKPAQRHQFELWINQFANRVVKSVLKAQNKTNKAGVYGGLGSGHWIQNNSSDGSMITLEDGSIWEVNSIDRIDTSLWLPVTNITVLEASEPIGEYQYLLVDIDDGEKALAKYLGN